MDEKIRKKIIRNFAVSVHNRNGGISNAGYGSREN